MPARMPTAGPPRKNAGLRSGYIAEFRDFAAGLRRDEAAVEAALRYEWSNGQTEGQVNKLKPLKRQGYGRGSVALLRQRLLIAA